MLLLWGESDLADRGERSRSVIFVWSGQLRRRRGVVVDGRVRRGCDGQGHLETATMDLEYEPDIID